MIAGLATLCLAGAFGVEAETLSVVRYAALFTADIAALGGIAVACYIGASLNPIGRLQPQGVAPDSHAPDSIAGVDSFEHLRQWLEEDGPIESARSDRLGHASVAKRVAARILAGVDSREAASRSQMIIGAIGSGKTSLYNLVCDELSGRQTQHHVYLERFALWPYETSRDAAQGVLSQLVGLVGQHVDVMGLRSVPSEYADAVASLPGLFAAAGNVLRRSSATSAILRRIDDVATAIGHHYALWVDDLERFLGDGQDATYQERIRSISALLYELDQLRSVTVVIATTSLQVRLDREKIVRYVEELPRVSPDRAAHILALFRSGCREFCFIDAADPDVREQLDNLVSRNSDASRRMISESDFSAVTSISSALPLICATPRTLKQGLRRCLDIWHRLYGEVDFDDLLCVSLVREAYPAQFAVFHDLCRVLHYGMPSDAQPSLTEGGTIAQFRAAAERSSQQAKKERVESIRSHWDAELNSSVQDEYVRQSLRVWLKFLLDVSNKPQGLLHPIYWQRYLAEEIAPNSATQPALQALAGPSDQILIEELERERKDDPIGLIYVAKMSSALSRGMHSSTEKRLCALLMPLVVRRTDESADSWPNKFPPGIYPYGYLCRANGVHPATLFPIFCTAISSSVTNLSLAIQLLEAFGIVERGNRDGELADESSERQGLTRQLAVHLGREFSKLRDPKAVALSLERSGDFVLNQLLSNPPHGVLREEWIEIRPSIINAARLYLRNVLPKIGRLVTEKSSQTGVKYVPAQAVHWFDDEGQLLSLFHESSLEDEVCAVIRLVARSHQRTS